MIVVHHLNESRSQRVLWLLEELGVAYEIRHHARNATTRLAPPELQAVHPLGKSPVIEDQGNTIIESGAIVDYLIRHYGGGRFQPATGSADFEPYNQWLHYAEGSAMLPLMLKLYTSRLGDAGAPLQPRINSEIQNHMGWLDSELVNKTYFVGDSLTGADVQLSFVAQYATKGQGAEMFPNLARFVAMVEARPAYQRAIAKGGA